MSRVACWSGRSPGWRRHCSRAVLEDADARWLMTIPGVSRRWPSRPSLRRWRASGVVATSRPGSDWSHASTRPATKRVHGVLPFSPAPWTFSTTHPRLPYRLSAPLSRPSGNPSVATASSHPPGVSQGDYKENRAADAARLETFPWGHLCQEPDNVQPPAGPESKTCRRLSPCMFHFVSCICPVLFERRRVPSETRPGTKPQRAHRQVTDRLLPQTRDN